jgi:hypothetical protein
MRMREMEMHKYARQLLEWGAAGTSPIIAELALQQSRPLWPTL